jgi:hypothetical protein
VPRYFTASFGLPTVNRHMRFVADSYSHDGHCRASVISFRPLSCAVKRYCCWLVVIDTLRRNVSMESVKRWDGFSPGVGPCIEWMPTEKFRQPPHRVHRASRKSGIRALAGRASSSMQIVELSILPLEGFRKRNKTSEGLFTSLSQASSVLFLAFETSFSVLLLEEESFSGRLAPEISMMPANWHLACKAARAMRAQPS